MTIVTETSNVYGNYFSHGNLKSERGCFKIGSLGPRDELCNCGPSPFQNEITGGRTNSKSEVFHGLRRQSHIDASPSKPERTMAPLPTPHTHPRSFYHSKENKEETVLCVTRTTTFKNARPEYKIIYRDDNILADCQLWSDLEDIAREQVEMIPSKPKSYPARIRRHKLKPLKTLPSLDDITRETAALSLAEPKDIRDKFHKVDEDELSLSQVRPYWPRREKLPIQDRPVLPQRR